MLTERDYAEEAALQIFMQYQNQLASANWRLLRDNFGDIIAEVNEDFTIARRSPDACGCRDWFFAESVDSANVIRVGVGCTGHGRFSWVDTVRRPEWMRTV